MLHFQRWKVILILGIVIAGFLFALPNVFSAATVARLPTWLPHKQVNLGLDLQGGAHLLYQLDEKEMIEDWLNTIRGDVRETLRKDRIGYSDLAQNLDKRSVSVTIREPADMDKAYDALKKLAAPVGGDVFAGFSGYDLDVAKSGDTTITLSVTDQGLAHRMTSAIQASIETIRRRVDAFGTTEPSIQREGRNRVLVQVPGIQDVERLKTLIGETGKLEFKLVDPSVDALQAAATKQVPVGDELVYSSDNPPVPYVLKDQVLVTGQNLVDAQPGFDSRTGEPVVTFRFDAAGAKRFGKVTQENVGLPFAIVLDNKVISAPVIREPILGGTGQISGNFTVQRANDLAVLLRSGALPAKLTVIEERTVGASLGADSIESGKKAAIMGLLLVMIFMVAGYGLFGMFANVALVVNIALIFAVLSLIGATLTLPGIAGIVLTIGIAVDANVLINERIREEIRAGKSPYAAVDAGYSRALDYHHQLQRDDADRGVGPVLAWLRAGPRICRDADHRHSRLDVHRRDRHAPHGLLLAALGAAAAHTDLGNRQMFRGIHFIPPDTKIDFVGMRAISWIVSAFLTLAPLILVATVGLNMGIDFQGGTLIEVKTKVSPADLADIRSKVSGLGLGEVQIQEFGAPDAVLIRIASQPTEQEQQASIAKVKAALGDTVEYRRVEIVGPTISGELIASGTIAVVVALIGILIYVWFRFEWQFAVAAIASLIHDVTGTIGLYSLFQLEFNVSSIAAILTIIGYSLNDKVVIFDRIRENLRKYKRMPLVQLLDVSINETLARAVLTHVTTFLAMLPFLFFGGETIFGFALAMCWGIVIGAYSSIFVASPLQLILGVRREAWSAAPATAKGRGPAAARI